MLISDSTECRFIVATMTLWISKSPTSSSTPSRRPPLSVSSTSSSQSWITVVLPHPASPLLTYPTDGYLHVVKDQEEAKFKKDYRRKLLVESRKQQLSKTRQQQQRRQQVTACIVACIVTLNGNGLVRW